jgi:hypothetical protein
MGAKYSQGLFPPKKALRLDKSADAKQMVAMDMRDEYLAYLVRGYPCQNHLSLRSFAAVPEKVVVQELDMDAWMVPCLCRGRCARA